LIRLNANKLWIWLEFCKKIWPVLIPNIDYVFYVEIWMFSKYFICILFAWKQIKFHYYKVVFSITWTRALYYMDKCLLQHGHVFSITCVAQALLCEHRRKKNSTELFSDLENISSRSATTFSATKIMWLESLKHLIE
jgi:hypothetical protein